jgi:hypothetical protein
LKKLGDGLMALFGYPRAQENDAERAVRAALAIQRALAEINARNAAKGAPELSARVGLESGPVVVEATGEVFGDAPNIAARVQAAAEPGSVLVTMNVQRQVAGLFVAEEHGAKALKGIAEPVPLLGHAVSQAHPLACRSLLGLLRGDAAAALSAAERLEVLGREQGLSFWRITGEINSSWARGRMGDAASGAAQLRRSLAAYTDQGARVSAKFYQALLAETEAEISGVEGALARIDDVLDDAAKVEPAGTWLSSIICVATFLGGVILMIRHPPRTPTVLPSPSRESRVRVVPFSWRRLPSQSCFNRLDARSKRTRF